MIDWVINLANSGWVALLIGTALAIIGIWLAVKGLKTKRLVYAAETEGIVHPTMDVPGSVRITYRGREIPRFMVTDIAIWNRGSGTIHQSDIAGDLVLTLDPQKVEKAGSLLEAQVARQSRAPIAATVERFGDDLKVSFSFLDPGDGFVVSIVHTSAMPVAHLIGTIKEMPAGAVNLSGGGRLVAFFDTDGIMTGLGWGSAIFVVIPLVTLLPNGPPLSTVPWGLWAFGVAAVASAIIGIWLRSRTKAPRALRGRPEERTATAPASPQKNENKA